MTDSRDSRSLDFTLNEVCQNPSDACKLLSRRSSDRDQAIKVLQADMESLKEALEESNKQTKEIIEIYKGMKVLALMLKSLGFVAKWVITIAAAFGVIVALWKYGVITIVNGNVK